MTAITGGQVRTTPLVGAGSAFAAGVAPGSSEERVVDAMLDCIGRWGLGKTTVEDVARSAGLSRATVYRLFPGGKNAILEAVLHTEVARLVEVLGSQLAAQDDLETCLTRAVCVSTGFLRENTALVFLREHEWEAVEAFLAFDRLDTTFLLAGTMLGPDLLRFLAPERASQVAMWVARVVVSYLLNPSDELDLARESDARRVVSTYLLPGLDPAPPSTAPSTSPPSIAH
jgi:AcrR family transcriptional regulator